MTVRSLTALVLFASLVGCGSERLETVRVEGRVTLAGGEWPAAGMIVFSPSAPAAGFPRRPGRAIFDRTGNFTVTTFTDGDGLLPGEYRAAVYCGESIGGDMDVRARSYIPADYQSLARSGLKLTVPIGAGSLDIEYDIPASADVGRK